MVYLEGKINYMGLLTPKNSKADKKAANKNQNNTKGSQFIKPGGSKPVGLSKKPVKTGGSRGS
jgi:hypothetical protein